MKSPTFRCAKEKPILTTYTVLITLSVFHLHVQGAAFYIYCTLRVYANSMRVGKVIISFLQSPIMQHSCLLFEPLELPSLFTPLSQTAPPIIWGTCVAWHQRTLEGTTPSLSVQLPSIHAASLALYLHHEVYALPIYPNTPILLYSIQTNISMQFKKNDLKKKQKPCSLSQNCSEVSFHAERVNEACKQK